MCFETVNQSMLSKNILLSVRKDSKLHEATVLEISKTDNSVKVKFQGTKPTIDHPYGGKTKWVHIGSNVGYDDSTMMIRDVLS